HEWTPLTCELPLYSTPMRRLALAVLLCPTSAAKPPAVTSVRLYVSDCRRLKVAAPPRFDFTKAELKTLDFSVGCYLIAHPKGVHIWDVGVVPDANFKNDGKPATKIYGTV